MSELEEGIKWNLEAMECEVFASNVIGVLRGDVSGNSSWQIDLLTG